MRFPAIRCAVCDQRITKIELTWPPPGGHVVSMLTVFCHGESESMEFSIDDAMVRNLEGQIMSQEGVAFVRPKIAP